MKPKHMDVRTWLELDKKALIFNFRTIRKTISPRTIFLAVIKSNAYGHGLTQIAKLLANSQLTTNDLQRELWFGVDSIIEALRLRREKIKNPILVLGMTLPGRIKDAVAGKIIISISSMPALVDMVKSKMRLAFHLKIDTGMHRQGFFPEDLPEVIKILKQNKLKPAGIYTHFASAGDLLVPSYTEGQLRNFKKAVAIMYRAGFEDLIKHSAASGGTLLFPASHMDMVRVGMALYGYYPSPEAGLRVGKAIKLKPVLSWKSLVGEVKEISKGSYIGYDLTERVARATGVAVVPVGYWHGFDRGLSSVGEVLVGGLRRRVLGRVSMDMITLDVTEGKKKVRAGDEVTIIGRNGNAELWADDMALKIGTSPYEVLTRINPLIHREIV